MRTFDERLATVLDDYRRKDRLRTLEPINSAQGRHITIGDDRLLNFSSNDYLGLSAHPDLCAAARASARRYGVGSGASALLSGRSLVHAELEQRLAEFLHRDRALLFSSGYLANLGVISALVHRHDHIFHDRLNHASLIDAVILTRAKNTRYPHVDMAALKQALNQSETTGRWIITDTIFSMDGDVAPLRELASLAQTYDAVLIGDDAHGFGVVAQGRGSAAAFGLSQCELPVQIVTFGKALGTAGAAVVGSEALIETLIQRSRTFIYDTAPPPMIAAATIAALNLLANDSSIYRSLEKNIDHFRRAAIDLPLLSSTTPIQPIMIGNDGAALAIAEHLRSAGIYTRAIRPPTVPPGTARLRICISAAHTREDIDQLVATLESAFARHSVC
jgi:8-amino-7-oxononanoate synthase